jgi:hypothetical protein
VSSLTSISKWLVTADKDLFVIILLSSACVSQWAQAWLYVHLYLCVSTALVSMMTSADHRCTGMYIRTIPVCRFQRTHTRVFVPVSCALSSRPITKKYSATIASLLFSRTSVIISILHTCSVQHYQLVSCKSCFGIEIEIGALVPEIVVRLLLFCN